MRVTGFLSVAMAATAGVMLWAAAPAVADDGGRRFETVMTGSAEVPGPGDPDGSGTATLRINAGQSMICYELTVSGIAPATAAHIHIGPSGVAGPIVVPLAPPTSGSSSACASANPDLVKAILKSPQVFYVNVHNADFPAGAVRGQLSK